jgi:hypothetical protein
VSGELSRRSFLSGVAKAAGAALVVEATLEDVKAFAGAGGRVSVLAPERQPFIASGHAMPWPVQPGELFPDGRVVTEWEPTEEERARIAAGERIRLSVWTFNSPLQPVLLEVTEE